MQSKVCQVITSLLFRALTAQRKEDRFVKKYLPCYMYFYAVLTFQQLTNSQSVILFCFHWGKKTRETIFLSCREQKRKIMRVWWAQIRGIMSISIHKTKGAPLCLLSNNLYSNARFLCFVKWVIIKVALY